LIPVRGIPFSFAFLKGWARSAKIHPFFIASDTTKRRIKLIDQDYGKSLAEAISEKLSQNIYTTSKHNTNLLGKGSHKLGEFSQ
jgi:hypothetical protein